VATVAPTSLSEPILRSRRQLTRLV